MDAERDAALTGACTADRNGSDCRDLVRDALIAQDRLPGDFILNAGNGYAEAPIRYGEYGAENSGDPRLDAVAARERAHIVEYNSTENVLAPYEDIARSIARDQGLALIIGGGMTLAVPGGGGSRPAGGRTVGAKDTSLISDARASHILHGDGTGGVHLWPGAPGKSAFPQSWSSTKVLNEINSIASDPSIPGRVQGNGRIVKEATIDGVNVRVVVEPPSKGGGVVTGFPTNVPRNPK